jgi:hypothetical protein
MTDYDVARRRRRDEAIIRATLAWWDFDGSLGTEDEPIEYAHIIADAEEHL